MAGKAGGGTPNKSASDYLDRWESYISDMARGSKVLPIESP